MNNNSYTLCIIATILFIVSGCKPESRYEITTKGGVTIKINRETGRSYRLSGDRWVELKESENEMSTSRELSDKELGELDFSGYVDDLGQFHATLHNNNDLTVEQLDIRISFDNMQTYKQYRKTFNGVLDSPIKPYATGRFEIDLNLPPLFEKIKGFMDGFQYKISAAIGH